MVYKEISEYMYKLFVVNTYAAAIQRNDGKYITKYFPVTSFVLEEMLKNGGSMGCYQQGYKNNMLKWICFDFDCPDKENSDVRTLYKESVQPFLQCLDQNEIRYLVEFSGRRGIHVWILFDVIMPKNTGYQIMERIKQLGLNHIGKKIHIDYFPATDSAKGNKVGKQVKFPLSKHKAGGQSYFIVDRLLEEEEIGTEEFWVSQLKILERYNVNNLQWVLDKLLIDKNTSIVKQYKYRKYLVLDQIEVTLEDVERILSETTVFKNIFMRMKQGQAQKQDWTVLLGTLSCCDTNCEIVKNLFATFPNYDVEKTLKNIARLKESFFPATFEYLYYIYELPVQEDIDLSETGFHYLISRLGYEESVIEKYDGFNEKEGIQNLRYTLIKEINYLLDNDEVPDIIIWNRLKNMKPYDLKQIELKIQKIVEGEKLEAVYPRDYIVYQRKESETKIRKLVSLSAEERILTTHLMLKLYEQLRSNWHSYSYNISLCSQTDIFYSWYSSWGNYIEQIKVFLDISFLEDYDVFVLDLKGFYDHIDFLSVYKALNGRLNDESKKILTFLVNYNENLMREVYGELRQGVPQGPAYGRVIAEQYLDYIIQMILEKYDRNMFRLYRYVDDIVVYCCKDFDGRKLYMDMQYTLSLFGLPINNEKSEYLGRIGDLGENERGKILHKDKFDYDLRKDDFNRVLFIEERQKNIQKYLLKNDFEISQVGYVFGTHTATEAIKTYYQKYSEMIFSSEIGRGRNFKKFFEYVFTHKEMLEDALERELFLMIPIQSLAFANCIHVLYILLKEHIVGWEDIKRLQKEFLEKVKNEVKDERTKAVLSALLLMGESV